MDTRLAVIGIIVEDLEVTDRINHILHDYSAYIVGRMGIPYAPADAISALTGKLGMLEGVSAKALYSPEGKA